MIAGRIYLQNGCTRVAGLLCHAQQNRLTVLEWSKAMGIDPTWSALVQVTTRVAPDYAGRGESSGPGPLTRPGSGGKPGTAAPLGPLSRVATGLLHGGRATQRGPNTRYVINALANSMRSGVAGSTRLRIVLVAAAPAPHQRLTTVAGSGGRST